MDQLFKLCFKARLAPRSLRAKYRRGIPDPPDPLFMLQVTYPMRHDGCLRLCGEGQHLGNWKAGSFGSFELETLGRLAQEGQYV